MDIHTPMIIQGWNDLRSFYADKLDKLFGKNPMDGKKSSMWRNDCCIIENQSREQSHKLSPHKFCKNPIDGKKSPYWEVIVASIGIRTKRE